MKLKRGDVLVKKRTGNTRRARVLRTRHNEYGGRWVEVEGLAPTNQKRSNAVRTHVLFLCDDGLPDGWVLDVSDRKVD
jgi:hypothetical protein